MQCDRGSWLGTFTVDIKTTGTLTWAYTWPNTLTITHQYKRPVSDGAFWLQPAVRRPGQFIVIQDNHYGTFMFYPEIWPASREGVAR